MNTDERLKIKRLSASACSLWRSYSFRSEHCSITGREADELHFIAVQRLGTFSPHLMWPFLFGPCWYAAFWTFTVAVLI